MLESWITLHGTAKALREKVSLNQVHEKYPTLPTLLTYLPYGVRYLRPGVHLQHKVVSRGPIVHAKDRTHGSLRLSKVVYLGTLGMHTAYFISMGPAGRVLIIKYLKLLLESRSKDRC